MLYNPYTPMHQWRSSHVELPSNVLTHLALQVIGPRADFSGAEKTIPSDHSFLGFLGFPKSLAWVLIQSEYCTRIHCIRI